MTAGGWDLGPNFDTRAARQPRPNVPRQPQRSRTRARAQTVQREPFTLPQIVRAYALEHDRANGHRPCRCDLCSDLRMHVEQSRAKRQSGGSQ